MIEKITRHDSVTSIAKICTGTRQLCVAQSGGNTYALGYNEDHHEFHLLPLRKDSNGKYEVAIKDGKLEVMSLPAADVIDMILFAKQETEKP